MKRRLLPLWAVLGAGILATGAGILSPETSQSSGNAMKLASVPERTLAGIFPAAAVGATVFLKENTDGTDDGVAKLLGGLEGVSFYKRGNAPGLIGPEDVVLIKINSQWAERGGTNTDLLKSLIQYIVNHPDGFRGEVIIADNGQSMFGSQRTGGSLDWDNTNSKDRTQSAQDVADFFERQGKKVSGVLWDKLTRTRVGEFDSRDTNDGFVVEDGALSTGLVVSYAKFTTKYGTRVSFKKGIWDGSRYDSEKLKVINAPVLKSHGQYQVTGAMKSYMGTPSNSLTNMAPHNSVGRGGMGSQMANTRFPVLNILDMIWITPEGGPGSSYARAVQKNMIAASTDPVALDYWASKNVLIPAAQAAGNRRAVSMDPDGTEPGSFGYWLRLSMAELQKANIPATMDEGSITLRRIP
ncbi:hypothetical protein TREPR_2694 [Treponema primitia ZAS-2]|uniref:DUF362 domain-containing protein n=1 Tax=Treponema primitia (strain ATCC BAA-887 / DSM 12427 / ZAS-2) TaxID=545694 RepID=F5YQP0_TREPZ|nr:DUF362 domain-containing protein [Treponema primitia]AEF85986.1 hypothetical protein TREPR_2694 [Treponema primitia ZAS-2]